MKHILPLILLASGLASPPALAAQIGVSTVIGLPGEVEQNVSKYKCEGEDRLREVRYVNASPNFLAITAIDGDELIMVTALAASGARYVSGPWVWWTKGAEATLYDERNGPDADPVATCIEANDIP